MADKREVARMTHADAVHGIAFSPSARFFATASADKAAMIWESTARPAIAEVKDQAEVAQAWISGQCLWAASEFANRRSGSVSYRCWNGTDIESTRVPAEGQMNSFV